MSSSIHRLHLARYRLAGRFNPPSYADTAISVYGYLVTTADGPILVDTGIGGGNEYIDEHFAPEHTSLVQSLARFNVRPADVRFIINSHLHFDHCGNNALFPNAVTLVQTDELATARALKTRYTVPWWVDHEGARICEVSGDAEPIPGISLIASPGHTPGHQSVLIESAGRRVLIAAQAAFTADEYLRGGDPDDQAHEGLAEAYVSSIAKLKAIGADETLFSHDDYCVTRSTSPGRQVLSKKDGNGP